MYLYPACFKKRGLVWLYSANTVPGSDSWLGNRMNKGTLPLKLHPFLVWGEEFVFETAERNGTNITCIFWWFVKHQGRGTGHLRFINMEPIYPWVETRGHARWLAGICASSHFWNAILPVHIWYWPLLKCLHQPIRSFPLSNLANDILSALNVSWCLCSFALRSSAVHGIIHWALRQTFAGTMGGFLGDTDIVPRIQGQRSLIYPLFPLCFSYLVSNFVPRTGNDS